MLLNESFTSIRRDRLFDRWCWRRWWWLEWWRRWRRPKNGKFSLFCPMFAEGERDVVKFSSLPVLSLVSSVSSLKLRRIRSLKEEENWDFDFENHELPERLWIWSFESSLTRSIAEDVRKKFSWMKRKGELEKGELFSNSNQFHHENNELFLDWFRCAIRLRRWFVTKSPDHQNLNSIKNENVEFNDEKENELRLKNWNPKRSIDGRRD